MNSPEQREERRRLTIEIFELTGQKVEPEDPIVTAAFFYSAKLRQAAKEIEKSTENAQKSLSLAVAKSIEEATKVEASKVRNQLAAFAEGLKKKLHSCVRSEDESEPNKKSVLAMACTLFVVGFCGVMVGSTAFGQAHQLSAKQLEQLRVGALFLDILPTLDK